MEKKRVLYVRSGPYELSFDSYNLQEVGLGMAFCRAGHDFDILYYTKSESRDQIIETPQNVLRILWRKGLKILRSGVYPSILNRQWLSGYDVVITSEYSQIMSVLLTALHPNVYIYNGPYYNLFKIPFMEGIYDRLFCRYLNQHTRKVFCKTQMAKDYIAKKGITNTVVVGVGLDTAKFDAEICADAQTQDLLNRMAGHRNLLCVGQIIQRKNVDLTIRSFVSLKRKEGFEDLQLVLVGKGDSAYTEYCKSLIPAETADSIIWCKSIRNAQMKFVYQAADVFLLPSAQEIFGMVLLEAMYFGVPTVSSNCAGAGTLIHSGENGLIVDSFEESCWAEAIEHILRDTMFGSELGRNACRTICEQFMWDRIAEKMLQEM